MSAKKKTVGVRIPDSKVVQALLEDLGEPILSSTLLLPGEEETPVFGWDVKERLDHVVDVVIDAGEVSTAPTTVVDYSSGVPEVTRVGAGLFSAADNSFAFNVAPECSGLRSLLAMTALMGFYAWYSQKTLAKKWILFLCSVPVAIVANVCRIILVVVAAAFFGQETAMGLWHDYSGYPIFLIGIALMLALDRLLNLDYRTAWTQLAHLISGRASS